MDSGMVPNSVAERGPRATHTYLAAGCGPQIAVNDTGTQGFLQLDGGGRTPNIFWYVRLYSRVQLLDPVLRRLCASCSCQLCTRWSWSHLWLLRWAKRRFSNCRVAIHTSYGAHRNNLVLVILGGMDFTVQMELKVSYKVKRSVRYPILARENKCKRLSD